MRNLMSKPRIVVVLVLFLLSCKSNDDPAPQTLYFPPTGTVWEPLTPASLGWNESALTELKSFLSLKNTRAFIVLKDGKIVVEEYFGQALTGGGPFSRTSNWYWASAGKTLTAAAVGIAADENKINLDAKSSDYLGVGWTSLTPAQESKITVRHQLAMTTGLDDAVANPDCTAKPCLVFKAEPGTRWAYHNAPYTLLDGVMAAATAQPLNTYVSEKIEGKIGMDGTFIKNTDNNVFYSTARSMARFGLLLMNKGKWEETQVVPEKYVELMISSSQNLNPSYGYLTWLNGKSSYMVPTLQNVIAGSLSGSAPAEMFAAMGKNGQLINVVPSERLVIIRMGDVPDNSLVPFAFQNELWQKLNAVIKK